MVSMEGGDPAPQGGGGHPGKSGGVSGDHDCRVGGGGCSRHAAGRDRRCCRTSCSAQDAPRLHRQRGTVWSSRVESGVRDPALAGPSDKSPAQAAKSCLHPPSKSGSDSERILPSDFIKRMYCHVK